MWFHPLHCHTTEKSDHLHRQFYIHRHILLYYIRSGRQAHNSTTAASVEWENLWELYNVEDRYERQKAIAGKHTHTNESGGFYRTTFFRRAWKIPKIVFPDLRIVYYMIWRINTIHIIHTSEHNIVLYFSRIIIYIYYYFQFFTTVDCRVRRPFSFSSLVHTHRTRTLYWIIYRVICLTDSSLFYPKLIHLIKFWFLSLSSIYLRTRLPNLEYSVCITLRNIILW